MKGQVRDEWLYLTLIRLENVALIIIILKIVFFHILLQEYIVYT